MVKKIILILIISLSFFINSTFSANTPYKQEMIDAKTNADNAQKAYKSNSTTETKAALDSAQTKYDEAKRAYDQSEESEWDIKSTGFKINVDSISPWMDVQGGTAKENVNYALSTIIQTMMVLLWSAALLVMTIGAGYIVLHHGQDELLSKWKSIFMSWVYALIVALSSYYLIAIFRYILFQWNN